MSEFIKSDEVIGSKADREMDKFWLEYKEKLESARWQEHYRKNIAPFVPPPRTFLEEYGSVIVAAIIAILSIIGILYKPWR